MMIPCVFGFIIQNDSLAMMAIALKYEYLKVNETRYRYSTNYNLTCLRLVTAASSMISKRWKILTVTENSEFSENLVDGPSREWNVGCCQENVKPSDLI